MAGTIKGVTIDFNASTTKLDAAFRKLNAEANAVQRELRGINTLLRMNPSSVVLASQKTQMLGKAVKETEIKQRQLKQALAQANTAGVDRTSASYRKLERELELTNIKLKQLKKEQLEWTASQSRIGKMSTAMTNFGAKASAAANKVKYLSLAAAGVAALSLRAGMNFDEGMSKVQAVSGATGQELDALREKAKEMGARTKFSATEAAEAMNYMAMAGWKTEDMLGGISGVMNLAAASGEDLATTSDIVTDALTAFGLKAEDSGHFADVLAAASSNANTNVKMMGETFKYAAPVAGSLGFTIEDTANAIGLMANAGIKSSQAGTALRRIMTVMSKDFKISGKAIGDVTIKTTNADGSMRSLGEILKETRKHFGKLTESEKANVASTLVGKNAMSGFLSLMNASPKDIKKLEDALGNADGAAKSMADTMLANTKGSITILKSTLESAAISISETLAPMLTQVVEGIRKWVEKFNELSPATKDMIAKVVLFTAVGFPALKIIGGMASGLGALLKPLSMVAAKLGLGATGTSKFSELLAKVPGPAKLAVGAVGALALAIKAHQDRIYGATKAYEEGKAARKEAIAQAMAEASGADALYQRLQALMEVENKSAGQKATIKKIVEELNGSVAGLNLKYNEETNELNKNNAAIREKIENMKKEAEVAAYQEAITSAFKSRIAAEKQLTTAEKNLTAAKREYDKLAKNPHVNEEEIQGAATQVQAMKEAYDDATEAVANCDEEIDGYNNKILRAQGQTKGLRNSIYYGSTAFEELKKKAGQTGYAFSNTLIKGMKQGRIRVPKTVKGINQAIKFDEAIRRAKRAGINVDKMLRDGMISNTDTLSAATAKINAKIEGGIDIDWTAFGADITRGIAAGMIQSGPLGALAGAVSTIASYTQKAGNKKFKRRSPAKVMYPLGEDITAGIAAGMTRGLHFINSAMETTKRALLSTANMNANMLGGYNADHVTGGIVPAGGNTITINSTVSGAENPGEYAARLARQIKLQLRTV